MQFAVPQFIEVEDRLIGPLSLRQFLMLLGTGGLVMAVWAIFGFGLLFFVLGLPVALAGIGITFGKFNGRPIYIYVIPLMNFMSSPKVWVFQREKTVVSISNKKVVAEKAAKPAAGGMEPASRLKKLAYLLDQKQAEEEELIKGEKIPR